MRILVSVKQLPDHRGVRAFRSDGLVDREKATGMLGELDEYSLEQAVRLRNRFGGEVVALCIGAPDAEGALRRAQYLGADSAYLVTAPELRGSDANRMSFALARAVEELTRREGSFDLILCGMSSTDSYMGVVPAMLAERLALPHATFATALSVSDTGMLRITRTVDGPIVTVETELPALVSITDQAAAPRFVSFRDIAASRGRPLVRLGLADLGITPQEVGSAASRAMISEVTAVDRNRTGHVVVDDGSGSAAEQLAEFLLQRVGTMGAAQ